MAPISLPNQWAWSTLSEICTIVRGVTFPSEVQVDQPSEKNIACLRTTNVQEKVNWDDLIYIPRTYVQSEDKLIYQNDILISIANSRELVGKVSFVDQVKEEAAFGGFISVIRASELIDAFYLYSFLRAEGTQERLRSVSNQTTNIANLTAKEIAQLPIPLPPLSEQRRITSILQQAEKLRTLRQDANKKAKALQKALFYEMFGDPDPERNTRGWDIVKIGNVLDVGTGGTPSRSIKEYYGGPHNWVKTTELKNEIIFSTEETITDKGLAKSNAKIYPVNTVLVAMYGQGQTRGRTAKLGVPASVNQACGAFLPSDDLLPDYIWHWFQNSYERMRNMSRGGPQENLNLQILKDLLIPKPPRDIQLKFVTSIEQYRTISVSIAEATKHLDKLFLSITSRALTGELTSSWREKHIDEFQRAEVEQDKKSWHQDEEVAIVSDVIQSNVATEKENRFIEQLALIETIFKMVRNNIPIGAQPYSIKIRLIVRVLMENEAFSTLIRLAQEISDQTIIEKGIQKTVDTSDESFRNWLSFVFPYTPSLSPLISRVNAPIEEYAVAFIEYVIAQASSTSERIELEKEIRDVQLSPEQEIIFDKIRTYSGYFAAENLSEKFDIPLQDVRSSLELFQALGLVVQISIADEANSTPEFTIFASTYRTVRPSDNVRQNDLNALKPNLEEPTQ